MKYTIIFLLFVLCFGGCGMKGSSEDKAPVRTPRTAVTLTRGVYGHIEQTKTFSAVTVYRNKSVILAPISGFITEMFVQCGTRVKENQLIYNLESKERHAIGESVINSVIPIKAMRKGIVLDVQQQVGNYVVEGTTLCTIAESESLVFEINVPYEQREQVRSGDRFMLELPDGTHLPAIVQQPLATMNTVSQSECVIASAQTSFLPEGLHLKALFVESKSKNEKSMILPKSAVQSDETLSKYWVMKLAGDSTAVKVPVVVTGCNSIEIEIMSDSLSPKDDIILTGGYGLENGARVEVIKQEAL